MVELSENSPYVARIRSFLVTASLRESDLLHWAMELKKKPSSVAAVVQVESNKAPSSLALLKALQEQIRMFELLSRQYRLVLARLEALERRDAERNTSAMNGERIESIEVVKQFEPAPLHIGKKSKSLSAAWFEWFVGKIYNSEDKSQLYQHKHTVGGTILSLPSGFVLDEGSDKIADNCRALGAIDEKNALQFLKSCGCSARAVGTVLKELRRCQLVHDLDDRIALYKELRRDCRITEPTPNGLLPLNDRPTGSMAGSVLECKRRQEAAAHVGGASAQGQHDAASASEQSNVKDTGRRRLDWRTREREWAERSDWGIGGFVQKGGRVRKLCCCVAAAEKVTWLVLRGGDLSTSSKGVREEMAEAEENDGDAESMSLDEFKQAMFRSLRDTGTVEMIRAQLRRKFIEKLQQHGMKDRNSPCDAGAGAGDGIIGPDSFAAIGDEGSENDRNSSNYSSSLMDSTKRRVTQWSGDEKLVNGLLFDYFDKKALEHSVAVFVPEIGGAKSYVAADTILQMMNLRPDQRDKFVRLIVCLGISALLVRGLLTRVLVVIGNAGAQSEGAADRAAAARAVAPHVDPDDGLGHADSARLPRPPFRIGWMNLVMWEPVLTIHRPLCLENQLRRVETAYLLECENQKNEPTRSLEERMLQYQSEYDAIAEKRLQEELERFKTMELVLMRVEERKKHEKEADKLRSSLLQEHRQKSERLQEKERDLELAFVAKRTELETSLFETRQSLFQEMEKLRVKEAQLQVKVETDFRNFAAETKRLQLWEENTRTQERNLERLVAQAIREKEHELQLERSKLNHLLKVKEEELVEREGVLSCEKETIKSEKLKHKAVQDDLAQMEEALSNMEQSWKDACKVVAKLEKEKKRLQDDVDAKENDAEREKGTLQSLSASIARLAAEKELLQNEIERYKLVLSEHDISIKQLALELKESQEQLLAIKMEEANALVGERKRFMKALDDDREQFQWKENELLTKLRDFQSRLAESEAAVERFHSQYEDEKLHVESLRQEVTNLNALLSQARATINAKHGTVSSSHRTSRGGNSSEMGTTANGFAAASGDSGSDRMLMVRMMEMMSRFQSGNQFMPNPPMTMPPQPGNGNPGVAPGNYAPVYSPYAVAQTPPPVAPLSEQSNTYHEDDRKLKEEQQRLERELLEQREHERKKAERTAQEEREIAERKRLFDEELACQRQARLEEDKHLEIERRKKLAEEEGEMQQELDRQRKTLQDAAELQQRLVEERSAADKQRLQDEQAYQDRMRAENLRLEQELETKRLQRLQEEEKEEVEAKQRRKEARARKLREEEEEEKVSRETQRQREEAELAAAAAVAETERARVELAEQERRRLLDLENEKRKQEREEEERAERERLNQRVLDEQRAYKRIQEEQETDQQGEDDGEAEVVTFTNASLESLEDGHTVTPVTESLTDGKTNQLEKDERTTTISDSENTAQKESIKTIDETENLADEVKQDPKDEQEENTSVAPAEEKPKGLTEEEQRQAAEEEKKKQDDATMDVYRQRVLARKAAEKQKQLEMEAEAERQRKEQEEEEAERERQQHQQDDNSDESEQELELSGGSFAESRLEVYHKRRKYSVDGQGRRRATMTLEYEIRATRRPLPRQLEVSDWSNESAKAATGTITSKNDSATVTGSLLTSQSRLSSGTSFPSASAYSSRMPANRYDTPLTVDNQDEWRHHDPSQRKNYHSTSESDRNMSSSRHSDSSAAKSVDWKEQRDPQEREPWDSSSTARSPEYGRISRPWRRQQERTDDSFDNQREDNRSLYLGRRDSFVDVSPLRFQREERADGADYSSVDKKYSLAFPPKRSDAPHHDKMRIQSPREQDRAFFSPFRTTDSTKSASPESESSKSDAKSLQFLSRRRICDFGNESGSEHKQRDSLASRFPGDEEGGVKTRRALFPTPTINSKSLLHLEDHETSVRSDSAPPSPLSSLSSEFPRESSHSPPSDVKLRGKQPTTVTPAVPTLSDPILSMTERREELYSFRKKMREAFARVDEMVDAHRDFFKSHPGSGVPVCDAELAREAKRLADAVFTDLAGLREQFRQLATEFQDSEAENKATSRSKVGVKSTDSSSLKQKRELRSLAINDDDDERANSSGDESDVKSRTSTFASASTQSKPTFAPTTSMQRDSTTGESTTGSAYTSSIRSSSPTSASSHHHRINYERGRTVEEEEEQDGDLTRTTVHSEDEGADSVSAIMNDNFSELSAQVSSRASFPYTSTLQSRRFESNSNGSGTGDHDEDGNVFKDFDKRMEEIRASLHSIARGKTKEPISTAAAPPSASSVGGHRERNAPSQSAARGDFQMVALSTPSPSAPRLRDHLRFPSRARKSSEKISPDHQSDDDDDDPLSGRDAQLRELLMKLSETGKGL